MLAFPTGFCIAGRHRGDADQRAYVKRKSLAKFSPNLLQCLCRNAWKGVIWKLSAGLSTGCVDNRNGAVKKTDKQSPGVAPQGLDGLINSLAPVVLHSFCGQARRSPAAVVHRSRRSMRRFRHQPGCASLPADSAAARQHRA
ncbi:hypothetical protein [Lysobacter sp. Root690]|uniref:hypothetical protein n=1 Tax=Lysobacter sp. Root690 TaxID=1736588 RepID=UPI0012FB3F1B|nr:hypothetical protein [Lysobacter sp. Root690]